MMNPTEVTDFLDGKLGNRIEFTVGGDERVFAIELCEDGIAKGFIPSTKVSKNSLFSLEMALAHARYGVRFSRQGDYYVTRIENRSDSNNTIGIAERHLEWHDYSRILRNFDRIKA